MKFKIYFFLAAAFLGNFLSVRCSDPKPAAVVKPVTLEKWDPFLDSLEVRTVNFFLETTDRQTGLAPDRWPSQSPASIAAVGFALTCYPIAVERRLVSREEAVTWTARTLDFLWRLPQNDGPEKTSGYKGFFYHFLKIPSGEREWTCELSTIDTALLLAGALFCQSYFDADSPQERHIRSLADSLYFRVDWSWAMADNPGIALEWRPERGFRGDYWYGYNEAMILYILALASPTHPVPGSVWKAWTDHYIWAHYYGQEFISFGPLFGHQFSHCWIDFRGIQDAYMREKGIDYFENSRRATFSQQGYAVDNPGHFLDYGENIWGFTACDGPADTSFNIEGRQRSFHEYAARGVSFDWGYDDGTIAPTAAGGSVAFAPEICIPALKMMRARYDTLVWRPYGFVDAFNPTYRTQSTPHGWFDHDYLGIDQGPMALMIENLRSGMVWQVMRKNPYIIQGLKRAGFAGGWME
jgi:hypothetical protein